MSPFHPTLASHAPSAPGSLNDFSAGGGGVNAFISRGGSHNFNGAPFLATSSCASPFHGFILVITTAMALFRSVFTATVTKKKDTKTKTTSLQMITAPPPPLSSQDGVDDGDDDDDDAELSENPLWPRGVFNQDVDELVNECLKDPNINIATIPDYLERQLYRSTIKLTLNALYRSLSGIHGHRMLGHEFRLTRVSVPRSKVRNELRLLEMRTDVEERLLEDVADRLLANKFVNQALIPDAIERPLYVNCLKILFRVLDLLVSSFQLTVCGHDISIQLEPSERYAIQEAAFQRASSSFSRIDMEIMKDIARQAGVDADEEDKKRWFWQRMLSPINNDFVAQIHASLYGLILGIIDDLLGNTELEVISDRIGFEIVFAGEKARRKRQPRRRKVLTRSSPPPKGRPKLAFLIGLGIGSAATASLLLLGTPQQEQIAM